MPAEFKKYQAIFMLAIDLSSSVMNAVMKLQQRQVSHNKHQSNFKFMHLGALHKSITGSFKA